MPVIDILREMRYTEPQVPPTMLRKETKELFLYTEGDYIHVNEQLKILNRKAVPVSQKENLTDSNSSSKCNRNRIIWVIYFLYSVHIIIFLYCKTIILLYSQIIPGNSNMLRALLKQMFLPNNYTTKDFHSQIDVFMAHEVHYFYPRISDYLNKKGLTYKAYVTGVGVGDISADKFMILAISRMWNISISTLSPTFNGMWNLYHESKNQV